MKGDDLIARETEFCLIEPHWQLARITKLCLQ